MSWEGKIKINFARDFMEVSLAVLDLGTNMALKMHFTVISNISPLQIRTGPSNGQICKVYLSSAIKKRNNQQSITEMTKNFVSR